MTDVIHEAVAQQARVRPDAVAVVDGDTRLDYRTLDAAADAYADRLREHGVGRGDLVPVLLPRSARLVAVLLGVLKCGAGYAALDRRWPPERLRLAVRALRAPLVVADDGDHGAPRWEPPPPAASGVSDHVRPGVSGDAVAMVFFTSGTTGEPKGVLSPHRATTRLFRGGSFARFGPGRVMPVAAPVAWDAFALELWGMLTTGGTAVVFGEDMMVTEDLRELVAVDGVDTAWLPTTLFNFFVEEDISCFGGLRQLVIGGERLSPTHVRAFLDRHPSTTLVNGYGPVESCVFVTTRTVRPEDCDLPGGIPIGAPVPGSAVHLRQDSEQVPAGAVGEICVAGDGLAVGYLADPEATATAFITAVVDGVPTRLYRTGDLGIRAADGVLHFLGRADRQVKIFGHRVEPAELEVAATRIPGVRAARAVPVPGPDGGYEHLALFYTADLGDPPPPRSVRRSLAASLPHYLVPPTVRLGRVPWILIFGCGRPFLCLIDTI